METIQKFINEAVKEYNSGTLTPKKLNYIVDTHREILESEYENNSINLNSAYSTVHDTFIKQKGKKISRKLDFKWYESKPPPNPFYDKS